MTNSTVSPARTRRSPTRRRFGAALAVTAAVAGVTGAAAAAGGAPTVKRSADQMLNETITADTHGRTLYALHPETIHHLLCRSRACLEVWPPLTVRSSNVKLQAGTGVQGRLALLRRSDGRLQVTLRGLPLYRFAGDSAAGEANGEGIHSFGGVWHAVTAAVHPAPAPPAPPAPAPMPAVPPYHY